MLRTLLIGLAVASMGGCAEDRQAEARGCVRDADCQADGLTGRICVHDGQCGCADDTGCSVGELCNVASVCQPLDSCRTNADCGDGALCDLSSGACFPVGECRSDVHCPHGQVCSYRRKICVDGCIDDADCPLSALCGEDGVCDDNLQCRDDNRSRGQVGDKCMAGICDPALGRNCEPCNSRNPADCGNGQAACLLYSLDDPDFPHSGACGEYCDQPSDCPWGFNCNAVSVVDSNRQCQTSADCGAAPCQRGEGSTHGYCGCANDGDCAQWALVGTCVLGKCGGQLAPCQSDNDCTAPICSADGRCIVGKVCGPDEGILCGRF
jgi:hypothetical protein